MSCDLSVGERVSDCCDVEELCDGGEDCDLFETGVGRGWCDEGLGHDVGDGCERCDVGDDCDGCDACDPSDDCDECDACDPGGDGN